MRLWPVPGAFLARFGVSQNATLAQTIELTRLSHTTENQSHVKGVAGWGGRIRTYDARYQKPLPYHLATPQQAGVTYCQLCKSARP